MKRSQIGPQYVYKRHSIRKWLLLVVVIFSGFIIFTKYHQYQQNRLDSYPIRGVSVDQQDGYLDFISLSHTGQKFIYIKATQGSIYSDNDFNNNYQRCQGANMLIGVYHIFSFDSNEKWQEANFNREVGNNIGSMPIGIKINSSNNQLKADQIKSIKKFIRDLKEHYDRSIIIWTTQTIYNQIKRSHVKCLLWLNGSSLKLGSRDATMIELQSNEQLNLDGQSQNVTQSAFNGNKSQWSHFVNDYVNENDN